MWYNQSPNLALIETDVYLRVLRLSASRLKNRSNLYDRAIVDSVKQATSELCYQTDIVGIRRVVEQLPVGTYSHYYLGSDFSLKQLSKNANITVSTSSFKDLDVAPHTLVSYTYPESVTKDVVRKLYARALRFENLLFANAKRNLAQYLDSIAPTETDDNKYVAWYLEVKNGTTNLLAFVENQKNSVTENSNEQELLTRVRHIAHAVHMEKLWRKQIAGGSRKAYLQSASATSSRKYYYMPFYPISNSDYASSLFHIGNLLERSVGNLNYISFRDDFTAGYESERCNVPVLGECRWFEKGWNNTFEHKNLYDVAISAFSKSIGFEAVVNQVCTSYFDINSKPTLTELSSSSETSNVVHYQIPNDCLGLASCSSYSAMLEEVSQYALELVQDKQFLMMGMLAAGLEEVKQRMQAAGHVMTFGFNGGMFG